MTITIDATYEDGVLKPAQPLPLAEHSRVQVAVSLEAMDRDPLDDVIGIGQGPVKGDGADRHDEHLYGGGKS